MRKDNDVAITTLMSGIAATLISIGSIFHKRFGFSVPCEEFSPSNLKAKPQKAQIIKDVKIFFVDEVSKMHCHQMSCLDRFLKE